MDIDTNLITKFMCDCTLCPRQCHADRLHGDMGYCDQSAEITAARASLHFWEEPCLSGASGSGTVFFSGCNLKCVFCQNYNIAHKNIGQKISVERLSEIFLELQLKGANNINLVTGAHFIPQIREALLLSKQKGLSVPIVYNSSGYEEVKSLRLLDKLVDIYLPDLKYFSPELGKKYSNAPDYFAKASLAIEEMFRQVGPPVFFNNSAENIFDYNDNMLLKRGVIVRHLILPGETGDSKKILRYLYKTYKNDIYVSIMNQYTPLPHVSEIPELNRKVTDEEYKRVIAFAEKIGIENGFIQDGDTAAESFIPEFDGSGIN